MKNEELTVAKLASDRLYKKYLSMFKKDGKLRNVYSYDELTSSEIRPTQAKAKIQYIRRLLLEVEKEL